MFWLFLFLPCLFLLGSAFNRSLSKPTGHTAVPCSWCVLSLGPFHLLQLPKSHPSSGSFYLFVSCHKLFLLPTPSILGYNSNILTILFSLRFPCLSLCIPLDLSSLRMAPIANFLSFPSLKLPGALHRVVAQ